MEINVKKDRLEINKIIENCLPLIKLNKRMTQECADAILVYFIEKTANKPKTNPSAEEMKTSLKRAIKKLETLSD
jgi:flagellar basal body-associated protein FliL